MKARALLLLALALWGLGAARDGLDAWIDATRLPPLRVETGTELRDRDGTLLRAYTVADGIWRLDAGVADVDQRFLEMLVAYEDSRFATHHGVDWWAVARAAGQAAWHGRVVSGGSTLTMQVARLLEDGTTGRWAGKLRQARLALALERRLSKDQILALYLRLAPYGGNLEGLRAASLAWFGKEPRRLTPAQSALLVALPQSPETRRPDRHPRAAEQARARVLARMQAEGVIDRETRTAALTEPVPLARRDFPALAPHLADRLRAADPLRARFDLALDAQVQDSLEQLAAGVLRGRSDHLSIAIMAMDHRTGAVLASVGSAGYDDARQGFNDMTAALRSPGSTLKPLIYGLAFDRGLAHPETLIDDRPVAFGPYAPQNFDGHYRGEIRVAEALRQSLNIPAVLLLSELGPERLLAAMRASGAGPVLPGRHPGLAVGLGGLGVTLEDMMHLYAMLGHGGRAVDLRYERGATAEGRRVLSAEAAWQVGHVLAQLVPPPGAPQGPVAWKTGTSFGHRDAWAMGYDGRHVVGVWIGRPDGTPVPGAFGGDLAAPVMFRAFQRLGTPPAPLPPPPPGALIVPTAELPAPLQRFRGREALFAPAPDAPRLAFPPEGAVLDLAGGDLVVKLRDGVPPFTLMADGRVIETGLRRRETAFRPGGPGFSSVAVVDARGRAARVEVEIR
ncbi:penicillin-binding protein 1C [Aquicoccus sp. SCR17]|nr:penicillin-binding protein 1C [Carideicomes alvinocaridis]